METATDNQLSIIEKSLPVFQNAGTILKANQAKTSKALMVGQSILDQWQAAWSIADKEEKFTALLAADERSNKYLVNCATALKDEKEARAIITQIMDEMRKMFTSCENNIDKSKTGSIPQGVQSNRDTLALEMAKEEKRKREEVERITAKQREAVEIKTNASIALSKHFQDYLLRIKQKMMQRFNDCQLGTIEEFEVSIKSYQPFYQSNHFSSFTYTASANYNNSAEITIIVTNLKTEALYNEFANKYATEMSSLAKDMLDKLPSKKSELLEAKRVAGEIEKSNAEQKKVLQEQQASAAEERRIREEGEQARLNKEAEESRQKAEAEAEMKKQTDQTMILFEQEASLSESTPAPEARQGYEITVLHPAGYVEIFQFWFQNVGKDLPVDKIGNTKLEQMKTWVEKFAHQRDHKIVSKFLKYEETCKAVNKAKKAD